MLGAAGAQAGGTGREIPPTSVSPLVPSQEGLGVSTPGPSEESGIHSIHAKEQFSVLEFFEGQRQQSGFSPSDP